MQTLRSAIALVLISGLFGTSASAAQFSFPCDHEERRDLGRSRGLNFTIRNGGDCPVRLFAYSLPGQRGDVLLDLSLQPGEEADVRCPNRRARSATIEVGSGGGGGALLETVASPLARDQIGGLDSNGHALLLLSQAEFPAQRRFQFGRSNTGFYGLYALAGDFDGDGIDTVAVVDLRTYEYKLGSENSSGDSFLTTFSFPGVVLPSEPGGFLWPLAGDFDGDGTDTVGLFDNRNNTFHLKNSNDSSPVDLVVPFGSPGTYPVIGDYDGDGIDTLGVYDPVSDQFSLRNSNSSGAPDLVFTFLDTFGLPLFGDFDGDGIDTPAIYSSLSRTFAIRNSNLTGVAEELRSLPERGLSPLPLVGKWSLHGLLDEGPGFPFPTADPSAQGIDGAALDLAFDRAGSDPDLHSLLVLRNGFLVREGYFNGFDASLGNNVKSVSKSLLSALLGKAIEEGYIPGSEAAVASLFPEPFVGQDPLKLQIEVAHLVTMSAGLAWNEGNLAPFVVSEDWVSHVVDQPLIATRGTTFLYSTGLTHLASAMIERVTGMPTREYARQALFDPLGISVLRWDRDPLGTDVGGAEVYLRPRDLARFGELYRNGGVVDGTQLLPASWIGATTGPIFSVGAYTHGGWWWQNRFANRDTYFAWGYGGQFIFVVSELDLLVVATSSWNVTQPEADAQYQDVFSLLSDWILPAVAD